MDRSIAILGAGESGIGAAVLAGKLGLEVFLSDGGAVSADRKATLEENSIPFEEGGHSLERILQADLVVKSPGIPDKAGVVKAILEVGIPVISEIEFAFRYMENDAKVIAITGTNGKTTTTLLTYHLLKSAGLKVALGGNVGFSLAGLVAEGGYDFYVVEISSFQLDGIVSFRPDVAILLNITPDHLDRYEYNFQNYIDSKFLITKNLTERDVFVYGATSEPVSIEVENRSISARKLSVGETQGAAFVNEDVLSFDFINTNGNAMKWQFPLSKLPLIGKHNQLNAMSAILAAFSVGISEEKVSEGLKSFVNAPHRLEFSGEIDGVRFINDSKATNVDAVFYALDGINEPIVWIAGGTDKGNDYEPLKSLASEKVKALVCLGVDNTKLKRDFDGVIENIVEVKSAEEAVEASMRFAEAGDVVLLSPACASFDLFKNYEHRGECFKAAVNEWSNKKAVNL